MSSNLTPELSRIIDAWEMTVTDPEQLAKVGITPEWKEVRALRPILATHAHRDLDMLIAMCRVLEESAASEAAQRFWECRQTLIAEAKDETSEILREMKRERVPRVWWVLEALEKLDQKKQPDHRKRLGYRLSTDFGTKGGNHIVGGGSPGSGKRK